MNRFCKLFLPILVACFIAANSPTYINGRMERVVDGDTLVVHDGNDSHKIRLYGIDCPESASKGRWAAQAGSGAAKEFTREFCSERELTIIVRERDYFGRLVGEIYVDGRSLNRELVRTGHAWWYRKYAAKDLDLKRLEQQARKNKRGLWKRDCPTSPWNWRKSGRK